MYYDSIGTILFAKTRKIRDISSIIPFIAKIRAVQQCGSRIGAGSGGVAHNFDRLHQQQKLEKSLLDAE